MAFPDYFMIYLYNPSTEMALASGGNTYTPPRSVMQFEQYNMLLPSLYANPGDSVLFLYDFKGDNLENHPLFRRDIKYISVNEISEHRDTISPWGWNPALRARLILAGYPSDQIYSYETIQCWRNLAHRRSSITINRLLNLPDMLVPREFIDLNNAMDNVLSRESCMLKMPWSSSGRGVLPIMKGEESKAKRRIKDTIARQGSVIIENLWNKQYEFATEWESDGSEIKYLGLSLFTTDGHGNYKANIVAPQVFLENRLSEYISIKKFDLLKEKLKFALKDILIDNSESPYIGPLGVDSMITPEGELIPCLEINLRRTMGHVAISLEKERGLLTMSGKYYIFATE